MGLWNAATLARQYSSNVLLHALKKSMDMGDIPEVESFYELKMYFDFDSEVTVLDTLKIELLSEAATKFSLEELEERLK